MEALSASGSFLFEGFRLDRHGLFRRDQDADAAPVEIGSRALDVLRVLLERPGDLVSRDEIMAVAWPRVVVEDNNLTIQIAALRRVLDQDRANGSCIQTVPRRGYRFVAPVTRAELASNSESRSPPRNSIDEPVTQDEQTQGVVAQAALAASRARYRLWVGAAAAAIGALVLMAAAGTWHVPWLSNSHPAPAPVHRRSALQQPRR